MQVFINHLAIAGTHCLSGSNKRFSLRCGWTFLRGGFFFHAPTVRHGSSRRIPRADAVHNPITQTEEAMQKPNGDQSSALPMRGLSPRAQKQLAPRPYGQMPQPIAPRSNGAIPQALRRVIGRPS